METDRDFMAVRRFFVSYSHEDAEIVSPVIRLLRSTGAPIFRDSDGISPGKRWRVVLDNSLRGSDVVIVFWSRRAKESAEVESEWRKALELKKDIIPVLLDETPVDVSLGEYQWIDFRSIIKLGHPWESILEELAQLILLRLEGIAPDDEEMWWRALRHRWSKGSI
jgi:TIR domain